MLSESREKDMFATIVKAKNVNPSREAKQISNILKGTCGYTVEITNVCQLK